MEQQQQPVQYPHGAPWYLVIILIVIALGASVAAVWFGIMSNNVPELAETMTEEVMEEMVEEEGDSEEEEDIVVVDDGVEPAIITVTESEDALVLNYDASVEGQASTLLRERFAQYPYGERHCKEVYWAETSSGPGGEFTNLDELGSILAENGMLPSDKPELFIDRTTDLVSLYNTPRIVTCDTTNGFYTILDGVWGYAYPFRWADGERGNFASYQPMGGVTDGMMAYTELVDGAVVLATGYGDAGVMGWQIYKLNDELSTTELIESCNDRPTAYDNGDYSHDSVNYDQRTLRCQVAYTE